MYFKIIGGKPYYYMDGIVYETKIEGDSVTLGKAVSLEYDGALYTVPELKAKCAILSSISNTAASTKKK